MKKILLIVIIIVFITSVTGCAARGVPGSAPAPEISYDESQPQQAETQEDLPPPEPDPIILEIPGGYTLSRIAMTLEEMGAFTAAQFIEAAGEGDFGEFPLIAAAQSSNDNRAFVLEGYLFPGTYNIYHDDTPQTVIRRILANTESAITEDLRREARESGYTMDEIITIASLIETEAMYNTAYMREVSSVIHNRLNTGMRLQLCETVFYLNESVRPFISGDADRCTEFYDTYGAVRALPAGAIGNPGLEAIRAALDPAETNYFFYLYDKDNQYHFEATYERHRANVEKYLR